MKIALFPSAFAPHLGGVEELTRQLAHALERRGHRAFIVTQRWPRDLPACEEFEGLPVYRVPFGTVTQGWGPRDLKARLTWKRRRAEAERETARIVAQTGADLVHIQCAGQNAYYAWSAARAARLPLVLSAQGELTMDASGIYQWNWMRDVLRDILRDAAHITACSADALADVERFAAPISLSGRARVIYNGIALRDFAGDTAKHEQARHEQARHEQARPYVFAMGRFVRQKGFDVLLKAFARAQLEDFDLILAGDGPEAAALRELAGGARNVLFWGRADRADVGRLLRGCAWFVLPSRVEPQGIVNLEAMACARAVVASRTGGVPEIVLDGETGVLVPPDDIEALASALRALARQPQLRERLGTAGQLRAQQFDWDALAAQYEEVYRKALEK